MYAKSGSVDTAHDLFEKMPQTNVVTWNAMIEGYVLHRFVEMALETFMEMQLADVERNSTIFPSILHAFAKKGALKQGMNIYQSTKDCRISSDDVVATALVDMYAKMGVRQ
ncbi:pentatricopeptide repeat-containing protein At1g31430-like [Cryptomeria japonica]|uniref:pentatricopeptide repeat-containing protein At1g31430-like n=1 Tax=Cryptomeria japonica TaxID=3369 RepID=UPI0027DA45AA|nr:pentatricopeptide repeat-containing protein At1g31430-like [Cryptomeria japonica]